MEQNVGVPRLVLVAVLLLCGCAHGLAPAPDSSIAGRESGGPASSRHAAEGALQPVYAPLAELLVERYDLAGLDGVGIDLGSGPGTLVVELSLRAPRMHWIDADIDPRLFASFFRAAEAAGVAGRVSALRADACALPFRDGYADVIVSRGSFHLWDDLPAAFWEIHRVLKPGGVAWIGRGFSENLPPETARRVRALQRARGGEPSYDLEETEGELRGALEAAGIEDFTIHRPAPPGAEGVNYGIWVEFRRAAHAGQ